MRLMAWRSLPQALQLAVAILTVSTATCGIAIVGGDAVAISVLRVVLVGGFLCALRIVTRPMVWRWPWLGAIASAGVYLAWSLGRLF